MCDLHLTPQVLSIYFMIEVYSHFMTFSTACNILHNSHVATFIVQINSSVVKK